MTEKWTPGPWRFTLGGLPRVISADGTTICGVHRIGRHTGNHSVAAVEANGRLIAAAPELYAALSAISEMMGPAENAVFSAAADALAKARGEA